jgi:hypothetical protein
MFAETCRKNILALADAYRRATGEGEATMSGWAYGNGTFFREFSRRKRSVSVDKYGEILAKFAEKWPKNAPWPDLQPVHFSKANVVQQRFMPAQMVR